MEDEDDWLLNDINWDEWLSEEDEDWDEMEFPKKKASPPDDDDDYIEFDD